MGAVVVLEVGRKGGSGRGICLGGLETGSTLLAKRGVRTMLKEYGSNDPQTRGVRTRSTEEGSRQRLVPRRWEQMVTGIAHAHLDEWTRSMD